MRDSLTDLADFVHKRGTPRLTHVRKLKRRGAYHPDFWKPFRDEIVRFHASSNRKTDHLEPVLAKVSASKQGRYSECISGYKQLLSGNRPAWFPPETTTKELSGLEVRVNLSSGSY